nr:MAG TPA: hypothetical protein [Caudoviricetes sp.]
MSFIASPHTYIIRITRIKVKRKRQKILRKNNYLKGVKL